MKAELRSGGPRIALDLDEVDLVDVECIRFLNACESTGISVLHGSPYIREWMLRELEEKTIKKRESRRTASKDRQQT